MRNITYFFLFFCCLTIGQDNEHAWVYFNDKPNFETYLDNPNMIFTEKSIQKAIGRRLLRSFCSKIEMWGSTGDCEQTFKINKYGCI